MREPDQAMQHVTSAGLNSLGLPHKDTAYQVPGPSGLQQDDDVNDY